MSIRAIAQELYRLQKEVERLERCLAAAPYKDQEAIEDQLRKARAEWQLVRDMLDSAKEPPPIRPNRI